MSMSRDNWEKPIIAVTSAIVGALLTTALSIGTYVWRQTYVQYATGGAYINPKLGLAVATVKNRGGSTAENVTLTLSFTDPFTDVSTDRTDTPFKLSGGGSDRKSVMGTIERLEPEQVVNIYFITEPSSPWADQKPIVRSLKFNGGLGRSEPPLLPAVLIFLAIALVPTALFLGFRFLYFGNPRENYRAAYRDAIRFGLSAAWDRLLEAQMKTTAEEQYRRRTLRERMAVIKPRWLALAEIAFAEANERLTPTKG
jgi:hypothetical protein